MSKLNGGSPASKFIAQEFPIRSSLISRLQTFLPELSAANEQLSKEQAPDLGISIEQVPKDDNEQSNGESSNDSGDESDISSEDEGPQIEIDMHLVDNHSSSEDEADKEPNQNSPKANPANGQKKKLIEEID